MKIKSLERPIMELSHNVVFKKATLVDKQYKLDISELNAAEKLQFVTHFISMNSSLDTHIQEYLNDACLDRMYAESQTFEGWDE